MLFSVHIIKDLGILVKAFAAKIGWMTKSLDLLFDYAGISQPRTRTKDGPSSNNSEGLENIHLPENKSNLLRIKVCNIP